ncbi:ribosome assembly protein 4, putative [Hepatocystis sp. ex Piliocolobus tephrosceles]|uniref:NLE domain-containing protein n=1 Tax=Piliocolobus tephrosceles TaxID=591936 RepID=A0A8C9GWN6_9PRIM|nr:ribosome assembly protein 4, putative [Hepatocystis sp. ex Piliocolobus tephrosceles]
METSVTELNKEILIQFVNHKNKVTGPVINVPLSITKNNLEELIYDLKKKADDFELDEDVNYSFIINDNLPIKHDIYDAIKDNNISSEDILSIKYFPLNIFKVKTINTCNATLPGHTNSILCLTFSPNSLHLATGSGDNTIRLWSIDTKTPIATLRDHSGWVLVVLFSPDNKFLATAGMDKNVCIYETHSGKLLNILTGHKKEVTTLCFEPLHLLKTNDIQKTKEKAVTDKKRKQVDKKQNININGDNISNKKSKTINNDALSKKNNNSEENGKGEEEEEGVREEEKEEGEKNNNIKNNYYVNSRLASAGKDGIIRINNILNNNIDKILTGHTNTITCILWSGENEKNSRIYSSSRDTTIKIWDVYEGTLLYDFKGHSHWVNCLSINTERILKNGIYDLDVVINKIDIKNCIEKAKSIYKKFIKNENIEKVVSGSDDGTLYLIDCLKQNKYKTTRLLGHQQPVIHVLFSPNGKLIASTSFDKSVKVWSAYCGTFLASYRGHVGPVYKLAWSIDNNYFVTCSQDSTLKLWKVNHLLPLLNKSQNTNEKTPSSDNSEKNGVTTVTINNANGNVKNAQQNKPDSSSSLKKNSETETTKNKKKTKEDEKNKKKAVKTMIVDLPGHEDAVYAIDWSNDGRYVASGGKDKVLKIWSY